MYIEKTCEEDVMKCKYCPPAIFRIDEFIFGSFMYKAQGYHRLTILYTLSFHKDSIRVCMYRHDIKTV